VLYDAGRSLGGYDVYPGATGSIGATIGHHEGSIGVVVGASYGVSAPVGADDKYPGTVVSEPVGVKKYTNTGGSAQDQGSYSYQSNGSDGSSGNGGSADSYSITKSIEPSYDGSASEGGTNSIQGYEEDAKGK
jgi:hypothetical protein